MPADHPSRPSLSSIQLMSNALAAVTAAVVGSRLGIAGTLVGAAAGSVIATTGTAMYGHWLDRTASRVRTVVRLPGPRDVEPAADRSALDAIEPGVALDATQALTQPAVAVSRRRGQPTWGTVVLAAAATFALAIGSITAFEAIVGEPVSTLTGGEAGSGTTLGRALDSEIIPAVHPELAPSSTPVPTTPPTSSPAPSPSPSETPTPTATPAPSPTSPAPSPTPTSPESTTPPPDPGPTGTTTPR